MDMFSKYRAFSQQILLLVIAGKEQVLLITLMRPLFCSRVPESHDNVTASQQFTPVLFLLWRVKMSFMKKAYCFSSGWGLIPVQKNWHHVFYTYSLLQESRLLVGLNMFLLHILLPNKKKKTVAAQKQTMWNHLAGSKHLTANNIWLPSFSPPGCGVVSVWKAEGEQNWWCGGEEKWVCALTVGDVWRRLLGFR